jgi:hypothetical protein
LHSFSDKSLLLLSLACISRVAGIESRGKAKRGSFYKLNWYSESTYREIKDDGKRVLVYNVAEGNFYPSLKKKFKKRQLMWNSTGFYLQNSSVKYFRNVKHTKSTQWSVQTPLKSSPNVATHNIPPGCTMVPRKQLKYLRNHQKSDRSGLRSGLCTHFL